MHETSKVRFESYQFKAKHHHLAFFLYLGVPASPSAPGYKSAAGSRVAAMLQKELPPVALLQQRPHRLPSLRAFHLNVSRVGWQNLCAFAVNFYIFSCYAWKTKNRQFTRYPFLPTHNLIKCGNKSWKLFNYREGTVQSNPNSYL